MFGFYSRSSALSVLHFFKYCLGANLEEKFGYGSYGAYAAHELLAEDLRDRGVFGFA